MPQAEDLAIMRPGISLNIAGKTALGLALVLAGCGKLKQNDPRQMAKAEGQAKRQKAACASSAAYDRLKDLLFDGAIGRHRGDRSNLDTLADYSFARMEDPVVKGWDPSLDIVRCKGRFILEVPPGTEGAFGGNRRLQADLDYTAQGAADGSGFVYQQTGGDRIVTALAAFNVASVAYRPPPAIDEAQQAPEPTQVAAAGPVRTAPVPPPPVTQPASATQPAAPRKTAPPARAVIAASDVEPVRDAPASRTGGSAEAIVRGFYGALGAGNGAAASSHIIPEKRSSRAFSPEGISRFYGKLREPVRLTSVVPAGGGAYRVTYRYSTGRSRCDGTAVVSVTNRGSHQYIRSIRALSGC